jgi:hypothetical protein
MQMEDTADLELYKTSKTPEGTRAQSKIVRDLFDGKGLKVDTAKTQLESYYHTFFTQHSGKAYRELTDVVGLDSHRLSPIQDVETVKLGSDDKGKFIDYLLERNHNWMQEFVEKNPFRDKEANTKFLEQMMIMADVFHSVNKDEYEVEITGPIARVTFKSTDAYSRFADSMSSSDSLGLFFPLPLRVVNKNGEFVNSSNTFVNLISPGEEYGQEDSVRQHEMYHAVDYFRLEQLRRIAEAHPDDRSINRSVLLTEGERFKEKSSK